MAVVGDLPPTDTTSIISFPVLLRLIIVINILMIIVIINIHHIVLKWKISPRHLLLSHPVCDNIHNGDGSSRSSDAFQRTLGTKGKHKSSKLLSTRTYHCIGHYNQIKLYKIWIFFFSSKVPNWLHRVAFWMALFSFSCYQQVGNLRNSQLLTTAVPAAPEKERHPPSAGGELARPVSAARNEEKSASSLPQTQ